MRYRVYLLDEASRIRAAETFLALDDAEALEMGAVLFRATHDVFAAYELWCGARHVTGAAILGSDGRGELANLPDDRQFRMLDLEERLVSSFACIRQSRALLDSTTRLMEARGDAGWHDRNAPAEPPPP